MSICSRIRPGRLDSDTSRVRASGHSVVRCHAPVYDEDRKRISARSSAFPESETWKRDYNLTRLYGDMNSTIARSANESEIGIFWTENTGAAVCACL